MNFKHNNDLHLTLIGFKVLSQELGQ